MVDNSYRVTYPTASQFEELRTAVDIQEKQADFIGSYSHGDDTQLNCSERLSTDRTNEILFYPEEWVVTEGDTGKKRAPRQNEFILLLLQRARYSSYISWLDQAQGLFKIHLSEEVAKLWGRVKNRETTGLMDYETFARGIRYYYKSGLMIKTHRKRTFRFKLPIDTSIQER